MKIAITGSSGVIGTALRAAITDRGDIPIRIVRSNPGPNDVLWDIDAGTIDKAALSDVDAVVHLAGAGIGDKKWSAERKRVVTESRTKSTALIAETLAGLETKPSVFVSGSAIGFYGNRGDEVLTEASPRGAGFLSDLVVAWEAAAAPAVDAGIRTALLRTGVVLSDRGGALKEQLPFFKLGIGGKIGDGSQWLSWVSITDSIRAILHIVDSDIAGIVNVTAPNPSTNAQFTKALGAALKRPTFLPTPKPAVQLRLGKQAAEEMVYFSARILPEVLLESGFTFEHPTIDSAFEAIL